RPTAPRAASSRALTPGVLIGLGNHGVADSQEGQEFVYDVPGVVGPQVLAQLVEGVHASGELGAVCVVLGPLALLDDLAVGYAGDDALPELHDVARQRAGLVRENVLDLPELLDEAGRPRKRRRVRLLVVHVQVRVYQGRLLVLYDLHRDDQAFFFLKKKVVEQDKEGQDVLDELHRQAALVARVQHQVPELVGVPELRDEVPDGARERHY
ncbi:MAG: hypothetical protein BJ554DRAFT_1315, partial [Olpidium bornovanus]